MDESIVRTTLNTIIDPCSVPAGAPAGIEEMGLVRELEIVDGEDGATIRVTLRVTEPGCVMGGPFAQEAQKRLTALPGVCRVEVVLDGQSDWTPADMSPGYRDRLEAIRALRRRRLAERLGPGAPVRISLPVVTTYHTDMNKRRT